MDLTQLTPIATGATAIAAIWVAVHTSKASWHREQTDRKFEAVLGFLGAVQSLSELTLESPRRDAVAGQIASAHLSLELTGVRDEIVTVASAIATTAEELCKARPIEDMRAWPPVSEQALDEVIDRWIEEDLWEELQRLYAEREEAARAGTTAPDTSALRKKLDDHPAGFSRDVVFALIATPAEKERARQTHQQRQLRHREKQERVKARYREQEELLVIQRERLVQEVRRWMILGEAGALRRWLNRRKVGK